MGVVVAERGELFKFVEMSILLTAVGMCVPDSMWNDLRWVNELIIFASTYLTTWVPLALSVTLANVV